MAYLKSQIYSPGVAATVALHAAFGLALLRFDGAQNLVAAAPVMVSLVESAGPERVIAPPKPTVKPPPVPKSPPPAPVVKAPESPPALTPPKPVTLPPAAESAAPGPEAVNDAPAPESAIVLSRFDADYLNNPPPPYPVHSRRLGEQGRVMLRVLVRADGTPAEVTVHRSSGSLRLDRAALEAVRKWRFTVRRGDTAIAAAVLVPISFTLEG